MLCVTSHKCSTASDWQVWHSDTTYNSRAQSWINSPLSKLHTRWLEYQWQISSGVQTFHPTNYTSSGVHPNFLGLFPDAKWPVTSTHCQKLRKTELYLTRKPRLITVYNTTTSHVWTSPGRQKHWIAIRQHKIFPTHLLTVTFRAYELNRHCLQSCMLMCLL